MRVSDVLPGNVNDLSAAREMVLAAIGPFAEKMPVLADGGYEGAGHGVLTPVKKPAGIKEPDINTRTRNALIRSLRCLGERGFALLTQRWQTLQHVTMSPGKIGQIARAALVLVLFEHKPRVPSGRRDGVKIPGAAALRLAGAAGARRPGLAGLCGFPASRGGRGWRMR